MNHSEDKLTRALHAQVEHMHDAPLQLSDIQGRATRIRRRRQALGTGLAVAAVAVIVPAAVVLGDALPQSSPDPDPAQTATGSPTIAPDLTRLVVKDLPRGGEPGVTYVHGGEIIEADGTATVVSSEYSDVVRTGSGWVGLTADENGNWRLEELDRSGEVVGATPSSETLAVTSDLAHYAWFDPRTRRLAAVDTTDGPTRSWNLAETDLAPAGMLAADEVVYNVHGVDPAAMVAAPDGSTKPIPGLLTAADASDTTGLGSGLVSVQEAGSCSAVVRPGTGERLWQTCEVTLGAFSPDGRHLIGYPAYRDGVGDGELAIYTAEGRPLWHLTSYQANPWFINDVVWEDDAHLLATVFQDGTWHLVRFGVDGSAELASPAIGGSDDMAPPVQYAAR